MPQNAASAGIGSYPTAAPTTTAPAQPNGGGLTAAQMSANAAQMVGKSPALTSTGNSWDAFDSAIGNDGKTAAPDDNTAQVGANLKGTLSQFRQNQTQTENDWKSGNISMPHALFQTIGNVLGGIFSVPVDFVEPLARQALGAKNSKAASDLVSGALNAASGPLADALAKPEIATYKSAGDLYQKAGDLYSQSNSSADPAQSQRLRQLADQISETAGIVRRNADSISNGYGTAAEDVNATANIGAAAIGGASAKPALGDIAAGASKMGDAAASAIDAAKGAVSSAAKKGPEATAVEPRGSSVSPERAQSLAWQDIQPKATPTVRGAYGAKSSNVSSQGLLSKAKLNPTEADKQLIDSHAQLYQDGTIKPGMQWKDKMSAVEQKAAQLNDQQKGFLADNDVAVNPKGLDDALSSKASKSTTIFGRDATAKGAYDSAIDLFNSLYETGNRIGAQKGATTLKSLDGALTEFDSHMDKFGAWERDSTGNMTDTDKARTMAIRDVHDTVRDFISDNLPKNSPWKAIRTEESNMYRIADRMRPKLGDTVGKNGIGSFLAAHPVLRKGIARGAGMIGLGALGAEGVRAL